ncbi:hypothetical protein PTTG_11964, partial [Puccinia triticina 1-1 BBBD Race 1]
MVQAEHGRRGRFPPLSGAGQPRAGGIGRSAGGAPVDHPQHKPPRPATTNNNHITITINETQTTNNEQRTSGQEEQRTSGHRTITGAMITSNHKKLVNACYPVAVKNKTLAAIAPDPNALSKLIYYCATRPHKIHKITSYLISYAQSQALPSSFTASLSVYRHSKPGLICTIKIFTHLIHNPRINPAILAPHLATIIAIGLGLFNQAFSSEPLPPTTTTTHHPETPEKASEASGYF